MREDGFLVIINVNCYCDNRQLLSWIYNWFSNYVAFQLQYLTSRYSLMKKDIRTRLFLQNILFM